MKIERQLQGTLNTIFTELIKERGLENRLSPYSPQEEGRADIVLKKVTGKPILFVELKDPTAKDGKTVFNSDIILREMARAQKMDVQHFGICNFTTCAFFDAKDIADKQSVAGGFFTMQDIVRLSGNYVPNADILKKMRGIANFYLDKAIAILDKKNIQYTPLDELFIFKIQKLIETYSLEITDAVWGKYNNNKPFAKKVAEYAQKQLWNVPTQYDEIERLTHISLLMLICKLIFYKTLCDNKNWSLTKLEIDDDLQQANKLQRQIWAYMDELHEQTQDFELLIGEEHDIIFQMAFVSDNVVELVRDVISTSNIYNFAKIQYDVIGRIFEELIRPDERHKLGQYFTPPNVIDFMNAFCIIDGNERVIDPSCGSGTFLVRAYMRKYELTKKRHDRLIDEIYGNDLSSYPAYLATLNLAIRNVNQPSYPRIANRDFFSITQTTAIPLHDQKGKKEKKPLPKFDAIIGNPPYTRQEDIGVLQGTVGKEKIQQLIKIETNREPSSRTSIYAYFFYHAFPFLRERGYLAYIVSNSWLDVDYGIDLQQWISANFEIVAILESEVERFFPAASVNTSIVILRKQTDETQRNNHIAKFITFKQTLKNCIQKHKTNDKLRDFILKTNTTKTTDEVRISCVQQHILATDTQWSKYLKAPDIYFKMMERGQDKFMPLSNVAAVKLGIKTGCNEFFILKDMTDDEEVTPNHFGAAINAKINLNTPNKVKKANLVLLKNGYNELWLIEKELLAPMLTSPKDVNKYEITNEDLNHKVLFTLRHPKDYIAKNYPFAYQYITYGETAHSIHERPSCKSRTYWYNIGDRALPDMSFSYMINDFGKTFLGKCYANNNFHNIYDKENTRNTWLYLNSTVCWFLQQIHIRTNMGDGVGKIEKYELAAFPFIKIDLSDLNIKLDKTNNYTTEIGSLANLQTVNPERLKLDDAILNAIGFTDEKERITVLMELYQQTVALIEKRFEKAQSLKTVKTGRKQTETIFYNQKLAELVAENALHVESSIEFLQTLRRIVSAITSNTQTQKKAIDLYWQDEFKTVLNEKELIDKKQSRLF